MTEGSKSGRWFWAQGPGFAVVLLTSITVAGTVGYMVIEGWNAWDAFYMTVITITTVGYREVHDLSRAGEMFTALLLIVGVSTALYTFTLAAAAVVEGGLPKRFQRRRAARMLATIKDHFIICGYGRIGSLVASHFRRQNVPYVVIERDSGRQQAAVEDGGLAVEADASREEVLKRVGIDRARGLIAAVSTERRERLRGPDRARIASRSVHHRPRRKRRRDAEAEARGRGPGNLAVSDRRHADGANGAPPGRRRLRGAGDELG